MVHGKGIPHILLAVYKQEEQVLFEVSDDGPGIPPELLETIFTGYYEKKDVPVDNQKRSMGIGLSVCAAIIHAHGGEISAQNLPGGGALFRFYVTTAQ